MMKYPLRPAILALALLITIVALGACGGGSEPEDREFDLEIKGEKMDPTVVTVKQGDDVTLRIRTSTAGAFHIHGYDLMQRLDTDSMSTIQFTADATGRFSLVLHLVGMGDERNLGSLEVHPR